MVDIDAWLRLRFSMKMDPWDAVIGAYGVLVNSYRMSHEDALERVTRAMTEFERREVCNV